MSRIEEYIMRRLWGVGLISCDRKVTMLRQRCYNYFAKKMVQLCSDEYVIIMHKTFHLKDSFYEFGFFIRG